MNKNIVLYIKMMSVIGIFYSDLSASQKSQLSSRVEFVPIQTNLQDRSLTASKTSESKASDIIVQSKFAACIQTNNALGEKLKEQAQQYDASMDRLAGVEDDHFTAIATQDYKKDPEAVYYHKSLDLSEEGRKSLFEFIRAKAALKTATSPDTFAYWTLIYNQSSRLVEQDITSRRNDLLLKSSNEIMRLQKDRRRNEEAQLLVAQNNVGILDIMTLLSNSPEHLSMQLVSEKIHHDKQQNAAIVLQAFVRRLRAQNQVAVIKKFNRIEHERIYLDMTQVVATMIDDVLEQIKSQEQANFDKMQLDKKETQRQIDKKKHALKIAAEQEAALQKKATAKKQAAQQSANAKAKLTIKKLTPSKVLKKEAEEDALLAACILENEKTKELKLQQRRKNQEDVESLKSAAVCRRRAFIGVLSLYRGNIDCIFDAMNEYDVQNKVFLDERSGALNLVYQLKDLLSLEDEYHITFYQHFLLTAMDINKRLQMQDSNLSVYFANESAMHRSIRERLLVMKIELCDVDAEDVLSTHQKLKNSSRVISKQLSDLEVQKKIIKNDIVQEITALHRDEEMKLIVWDAEIAQAEKSNKKLCALQGQIDIISNVLIQVDQDINALSSKVKRSVAIGQLSDIQKLIQQKSLLKSAHKF